MAGRAIKKLPTIVLALIVPIIAVATVLITLNATSDSTSSASSSGGKAGNGTAIVIKNFQFSPDPITVKAGSTVTVTNGDGTTHTLTADDKAFDTGNLDGGAKATIKIDKPGKYAYHCDIHQYMTGTIEAK
jgi:plastocyanin